MLSHPRLKQVNEEFAEENDNLYSVIDQLKEENDALKKANETIERQIRKEMAENMMRDLQRKERATEERMQTKINFLEKRHANDVSYPSEFTIKSNFKPKTKNRFIQQIADLEEILAKREDKIHQLKKLISGVDHDNGDNNNDDGAVEDTSLTNSSNGHDDSVTIIDD